VKQPSPRETRNENQSHLSVDEFNKEMLLEISGVLIRDLLKSPESVINKMRAPHAQPQAASNIYHRPHAILFRGEKGVKEAHSRAERNGVRNARQYRDNASCSEASADRLRQCAR
jgi:hypothetical protein